MKRPGKMPGHVANSDGDSGFEQNPHPLGNRLVEKVIVNRVQQVFAIVIAGEERADLVFDRARRGSGFGKAAFDGEVHDKRALLRRGFSPRDLARYLASHLTRLCLNWS